MELLSIPLNGFGLGDFRPEFGLFTFNSIEWIPAERPPGGHEPRRLTFNSIEWIPDTIPDFMGLNVTIMFFQFH